METFFAIKDKGTFCLHKNMIKVNKTSSVSQLSHSMIAFGCPYDKTKINVLFNVLKNVLLICDDIKRKGPASLDLCYVACGRVDAYI